MQLINAPAKLVLPFANAGAKNTIPTASQIGIVAGAASLVDGFPPLTRTPLAAGGVPPSGLDMNGILYELSAVIRWANAGGGYPYDASFATDTNIQGYPKGSRVLRSDGTGYWFNTTDGNTTDPEGAGAIAAGWVPDFTTGAAAVTMTSANVTLTAAQYGKPIIVITGLLTANLNLIFPSIVGEWIVINSTTGPYTITCKTAAGTGVVVNSVQALAGDATNIYSAVNDAISSMGELIASAGGTADALTATFAPAPRMWPNGVPFLVRAASTNATATPTFTANSGTLAAKTIVKGANAALAAGDIAGAGHWLLMQYDVTLDKVVLLNPATGVTASGAQLAGFRNRLINGGMAIDQRNAGAAQTFTAAAALAYCVDRWYGYCTGANVNGQRVADTADQWAYQFTGAASVTGIGFAQRIEALNCYDFAGKTVTLGVDLANSLLTTVTWTAYYANTGDTFGSLASPTKTQIATGTFTVNSTLARYNAQIAVPGAATTGIEIVFSVGAQTSGTWKIGKAQFELGSTATTFEQRLYGFELAQARRYFESSYDSGVAPGTASAAGSIVSQNSETGTTSTIAQIFYKTTKRASPTVTAYAQTSGASGNWTNSFGGGNIAVTPTNVGTNGFYVTAIPGGGTSRISGHYTSSSEL